MLKKILIVLCCVTLYYSLTAQQADSRKTQNAIEGEVWTKYYKGNIGMSNEVAITIHKNDNLVRGEFVYLDSKETLRLSGTLKDNKLEMDEIKQQMITGHISATINTGKLVGDWRNFNNTIGANLHLKEVDALTTKKSKVPNTWVRKYEGTTSSGKFVWIVQKMDNKRIEGLVYHQAFGKSYTTSGELDSEGNGFENVITTLDYNKKGAIKGSFDDDIANITLNLPDGTKEIIKAVLDKKTDVKSTGYADFMSKVEFSHPTATEGFNSYFAKMIEERIVVVDDYINTKKIEIKQPQPQDRATLRAYNWFSIDYFSDDLISMTMHWGETWAGHQTEVINYNLKKEEKFDIADMFYDNLAYKKEVDDYIQNDLKKLEFYEDKYYQDWIKDAKFDKITLREEGICYSTDFNSLFGTQAVVIPFENLKPYMKKGNIVETLGLNK